MPAWNAERTIKGAIQSILRQTYENLELLIINDASTDSTPLCCQIFRDRRLRLYNFDTHKGIVKARNFGNSKARGNIIVQFDADDFSLPDRLEKIARVFETTQAEVVVTGGYINVWNEQYGCMERSYVAPSVDVLHNKVPGWAAYKKEVWKQKPFRLETQYVYDLAMHCDWILSGFKYQLVDIGLYEYIRYKGSASDRFEKQGLRQQSLKTLKQIVKKEYGKELKI